MIHRRAKIVATLGPATDPPGVLTALVAAGADVMRLNFSHGTHEDHARRAWLVKEAAAKLGRDIALLADLQGPKIRTESFAKGPIDLKEGASFILDTALGTHAGDETMVGCAYPDLPRDVKAGDTLLLNDGALVLKVRKVEDTRIHTVVEVGGVLSNRKGINKLGGGLSAAALTDKDKEDLRAAVKIGVDFIAISFPRSAADMLDARQRVQEAGGYAQLVAKIERAEALACLDDIVLASDAVMVARGDLGVEIGDAELPGWQKRIIASARENNRMVITATQMMESMIVNPIPTRAEVLDVANAVMDGTDAVMLSAETASGKHPIKVVESMVRVILGAEKSMSGRNDRRRRLDTHFSRTDEAIAMATVWTAQNMQATAIVALTESGSTALMMSRAETDIPIYALTQHERTRRRMCLCRDVVPIEFLPSKLDTLAPVREAVACLVKRKLLKTGDRVLITKGDFNGTGGTNEMKIITV